MNVKAYLTRIGIAEPAPPGPEALRQLQRAHLYAVPYENMDILAGIPLSLRAEDLYEKIVTRNRGGYCFELNELFGWLLRQLGYQVSDYFGRFLRDEPGIPMRRHHILAVTGHGIAIPYVCDVGVGTGSPALPVLLAEGLEQPQDDRTYRFTKDHFLGWVLEECYKDQWRPIYSFTEEPQLPVDFVAASFYCEKSPESIFNKEPMVSLRCEGGRRTLDGNEFRHFHGGKADVKIVTDPVERDRLLGEWFGIVL